MEGVRTCPCVRKGGKGPDGVCWKEQCERDRDMKKEQHTRCWASGPCLHLRGELCAGRKRLLSRPVLGVLKPFSWIP